MQLVEFDFDSKTHKWAIMYTSDETIHKLRSPGSNKHAHFFLKITLIKGPVVHVRDRWITKKTHTKISQHEPKASDSNSEP